MLNLSDKDLDRLSQEAAQQHEPGDIVGPKFWDKLEARLDRDLGKMTPNPARGIRRLPYYYAPAVLVLLGITYYLVRLNTKSQRHPSGSPPLTIVQQAPAEPLKPASSSQNAVPSDKSNSTLTAPANTVHYPAAGSAADAPIGSSTDAPANSSAKSSANPSTNSSGNASTNSSGNASTNSSGRSSTNLSGNAPTNASAKTSAGASTRTSASVAPIHDNAPAPSPARTRSSASASDFTNSAANAAGTRNRPAGTPGVYPANPNNSANSGRRDRHHNKPSDFTAKAGSSGLPAGTSSYTNNSPGITSGNTTPSTNSDASARAARELTFSSVRGPVRVTPGPNVVVDNPTNVGERVHHGLHVNRSLTFGLMAGPDYSSVNSLSGQRPGSTVGITADYQFANHWYVGSGLLFSRKIYAAAPQDFHTPPDYYRQNMIGTPGSDVDYIKGSFNMLEVPVNIRYDFNTGGNLLFFISAGASSYFFTRENCGYYFNWYNTRGVVDKQMTYSNHPDNLFASLNLSIGAELGISNSVSVLMAPYYKIPIRNLGFGQVQLSSVGINFAFRIAPVISRKRY